MEARFIAQRKKERKNNKHVVGFLQIFQFLNWFRRQWRKVWRKVTSPQNHALKMACCIFGVKTNSKDTTEGIRFFK